VRPFNPSQDETFVTSDAERVYALKPKSRGLDVVRPHVGESMLNEVCYQAAAYETPSARHHDGRITVQVRESSHRDSLPTLLAMFQLID
jgi:hypothetical protein